MEFEPICVLCSQCDESLIATYCTIFFECVFSCTIWEVILSRFQITVQYGSAKVKVFGPCCLSQLLRARSKNVFHLGQLRGTLQKLDLMTSRLIYIYIDDNIQLRVCTRKHFPNSYENQRLCSHWNISVRALGNIAIPQFCFLLFYK